MEALVFRILEKESEVELFLERFQDYVGVKLPPDYVARSKVVGAFLHERMVGGYMLVVVPNFRSLMFVPDKIKTSSKFFQNDLYNMMEVNGLWISSSLRDPKLQLSIWFRLVRDIFKARKKYVLLMRDNRNKTMARLLNLANPTSLYEGPPALMIGDATHNQIQVSVATRWGIVLNTYKYWMELRSRQKRAEKFAMRLKAPARIETKGTKVL